MLGEGLWEELGRSGVDVMVVAPGTIRTPTITKSTPADKLAKLLPMEPEEVVREALDRLARRSGPTVIPGRFNRWSRQVFGRLLSRRATVRIFSNRIRGTYGGQGA